MAAIQGDVGLFLSGQPVPIKECNIIVTPPKVKEVTSFGEDNFFNCLQILTETEQFLKAVRMGNSELEKYSDFQLLLIVLNEEANSQRLVNGFFELVFPNYQVIVSDNSIDFTIEQKIVGRITPFNFESMQKILFSLFQPGLHGSSAEIEYNPVDDKAKEIAEKIKKGREKKKAQSGKDKKKSSLFGMYTSILSLGMSIDINVFYNYTPFQLYDCFNRFFSKMQYDYYKTLSTQPFMDISKIDAPEDWYDDLYQ